MLTTNNLPVGMICSPPGYDGTNIRLDAAALAAAAKLEQKARAARSEFFNGALFSDPAWDIILELFVAEHEGRRVQISAVGLVADIPQTTVLRWLSALEAAALIERHPDMLDRRRTFVHLTDHGSQAVAELFMRRAQMHPPGRFVKDLRRSAN